MTPILRRIVGLWDSLDAVGPEVPAEPLKRQMDALIEEARSIVEAATENPDELIRALSPFANMHRKGGDPNEHACVRGISSDMTVITSGDFARAYYLMPEQWRLEHDECYG